MGMIEMGFHGRKSHGFTIIEAAVAGVVLAAIVTAVVPMMVLVQSQQHAAHVQRQALLAADDLGQSLNVVEEEMFGANHADVGSYILGLWGLPPSLIEAVAFHHDPLRALGIGFTPLTAVHVADALVHAAETTPTEGKALPIDEQYLKTIGVFGALPTWRSLPLPKQRQGAKA